MGEKDKRLGQSFRPRCFPGPLHLSLKGQGDPSPTGLDEAGDPGRTPRLAEGDEQTVEEDLQAKAGKNQ